MMRVKTIVRICSLPVTKGLQQKKIPAGEKESIHVRVKEHLF